MERTAIERAKMVAKGTKQLNSQLMNVTFGLLS
jgi:hypothetical protein